MAPPSDFRIAKLRGGVAIRSSVSLGFDLR